MPEELKEGSSQLAVRPENVLVAQKEKEEYAVDCAKFDERYARLAQNRKALYDHDVKVLREVASYNITGDHMCNPRAHPVRMAARAYGELPGADTHFFNGYGSALPVGPMFGTQSRPLY